MAGSVPSRSVRCLVSPAVRAGGGLGSTRPRVSSELYRSRNGQRDVQQDSGHPGTAPLAHVRTDETRTRVPSTGSVSWRSAVPAVPAGDVHGVLLRSSARRLVTSSSSAGLLGLGLGPGRLNKGSCVRC